MPPDNPDMNKSPLILILILTILSSCRLSGDYFRIEGFAQGGTYHVTYSSLTSSGTSIKVTPDSVKAGIDSILLAVDNSLSGYNKFSTLSKINSNQLLESDSLLRDIFNISYKIYQETEGSFDPSAAPLFDLWGFGFSRKQEVSRGAVDSIKAFIGMDMFSFSPDGKVIKKDKRAKLNFNAVAQGYSCDLVAAYLEKLGICDYLVEVGMEIYCRGKNPHSGKWNIGIDVPRDGNMTAGESIKDVLTITDAGIVTSGNYRKFYVKDGQKFSHTIDPVSGYPVRHNLLSATIIAADAASADAYATYCMVAGLEESKEFLSSRSDLMGYLIYGDQDDMKVYFTENLKKLIRK